MREALLIVLLVPTMAMAGWSSNTGTVERIYSHNGTILIDTTITGGPCGDGKGFWWPTSDDDSEIMLTLAITAFSTGKEINVVYDPSSPHCAHNKAKITHMRIDK